MNELVRHGHRPGTDGFRQVSEPSQDDLQLRDAFSAFNKLSLWNRLAFGRRTIRTLYTQIAGEFAPASSPVLIRQAVIMVGGTCRPLDPPGLHPKPLIEFSGMPILELLLRRMKAIGVQEVILAVNHPGHAIEAHFGNGSKLGLRLYYNSNEGKPLGAAATLGNMLDLLDETFFLVDSELLTTIDLRRMALNHVYERADASIGVSERESKINFGLIEFDTNNRLRAYREGYRSKYYVNLGVYILQREAIRAYVLTIDCHDIPNLLLNIHADNGNIVCFEDDCIWLDVARSDDLVANSEAS